MKKVTTYLLIFILLFGIMGCSNQLSTSTSLTLKQKYAKTFSSTFANEAESIVKTSVDLYNLAISNKIPEKDTFEYKYKDFEKIVPKNADEKDFQDTIHQFGLYYSMLALDTSILKSEQDLRDRGIESKDQYEKKTIKYTDSQKENFKHIKSGLENIMKYYEK